MRNIYETDNRTPFQGLVVDGYVVTPTLSGWVSE